VNYTGDWQSGLMHRTVTPMNGADNTVPVGPNLTAPANPHRALNARRSITCTTAVTPSLAVNLDCKSTSRATQGGEAFPWISAP